MILTGRTVALVAVGAALSLITRQTTIVVVWSLVVLAAAFVDWLVLPRHFTVTRAPLAPVRLSESVDHTFTVANTSGRTIRGHVRDAWQPSAGADKNISPIDVAPNRSARITTRLHPRRRGNLYASAVVLRARSRLGFAIRQTTVPAPATLHVLPEFKSRRHLPSRLARLRELDGQTSLLVRGEGTEFDSLREYVDGDDVRSLDWRASARFRDLVVRTWRPERDRRVLIIIDTSRLAAARLDDETRLDAGIETALLMSALANQAGDRVSVLAADRQIHARVIASEHAGAMAATAAALGPLEPNLTEPDWPMITRAAFAQLTGRALIILCTAVDPSAMSSGLIEAAATLASRHNVLIASATDPHEASLLQARETDDDLFIAAAAARTQHDRSVVEDLLTASGAQVLSAPPDELPPMVADRYLALKAAGKL